MFKKHQMVLCTMLAIGTSHAGAQYLGPSEYLAFNDPAAGSAISPFANTSFERFYLEDFEDGSLNAPGVRLLEIAPTNLTTTYSDSVDGDDGHIDGFATGTSRSLFSNMQTSSFTFTFNASALGGRLPTHAGIVWTDVGVNGGGGPRAVDLVNNTTFEAFDASGHSLGVIGPYSLGDNSISRTTAEDRFFGVESAAGISSIRISMPGHNNWEVDHLQYGVSPVPEPPTSLLLGIGVALGAVKVRRARHVR